MEKGDETTIKLKKYLIYAQEFDTQIPVVAMACRQYYMENFLQYKTKTGQELEMEDSGVLSEVIQKIEMARSRLGMNPQKQGEEVERYLNKMYEVLIKAQSNQQYSEQELCEEKKKLCDHIELLSLYKILTPGWKMKQQELINLKSSAFSQENSQWIKADNSQSQLQSNNSPYGIPFVESESVVINKQEQQSPFLPPPVRDSSDVIRDYPMPQVKQPDFYIPNENLQQDKGQQQNNFTPGMTPGGMPPSYQPPAPPRYPVEQKPADGQIQQPFIPPPTYNYQVPPDIRPTPRISYPPEKPPLPDYNIPPHQPKQPEFRPPVPPPKQNIPPRNVQPPPPQVNINPVPSKPIQVKPKAMTNPQGKFKRGTPQFYVEMQQAQKNAEYCLNELKYKNKTKARKFLVEAIEKLESLELGGR